MNNSQGTQRFSTKINLLPNDVLTERRKSASVAVVTRFSIAALVILTFLTGAVLAVRIMQRLEFERSTDYLSEAEAKVGSYQEKETQLLTLKQYLSSINSFYQLDSKKKSIFGLVAFLAPSDVTLSDITVGSDASTVVSGVSSSLVSIDKLISELTSPEKVGDVVAKVELDGLSIGKESNYRFGLKITAR